ncbi:hypothetical protein PP641_gp022 [Arthrobacter phage SilentRX]|uniref:Uncharacterized protein n=1 Tax=Arthrobacter phage SilentRX TaxID=2836091 RepID=A0A8F3IP57_9CAUD|nr:hypothetical protein PP641_gp022 [Arthrobacter phage SilentRX]QWY82763.1 hypothetical protein SEA_SILENTRX_22 [Arthrobacter phage SilentRX]
MVALEAPELATSARKTLLDAAHVVTDAPEYALQNALKYEPRIVDGVIRDVPTDGSAKLFDKRSANDVTPELFTAYRGLDEPLLRGLGEGQAELEKLFEAGESLFVEDKVQELLLNTDAVDITPGGTAVTDAKGALGLLEQWIATRYLFRPTISGDLLAANLISPGTPYATETVSGTPIAQAAGFSKTGPGGKVAGEREAWLYISGQINIWKGAASVQGGPALKQNRDFSLVEKSYAVSIDGPVAAILVGF